MTTIYLDTETYSEVPIKHGTYAYTSACEVMLLAYARDDGEVDVIDFTATPKVAFLGWPGVAGEKTHVAHNAMFDRNALRYALGIDIPPERWRCTMVKALLHGIPGGLDLLCEIYGLAEDKAKQKDGKQLINLFCKPRPEGSKIRRATRETHPQEWERFIEYCRQDVIAMRTLDKLLPSVNWEHDKKYWFIDQRINDRGMPIDVEFAKSAVAAVEREQRRINIGIYDATGGAVDTAMQRDAILDFICASHGIDLPDLTKATVERRIKDENLPREVREILAMRLDASSTSTSKYRALIRGTSNDGRLRGTLQFSGAARTRRSAGRTFQPTNLPRQEKWFTAERAEQGIFVFKAGAANLVEGDVMGFARNAIRGAICAPVGRRLVVSDYANIEGRIAAWQGGEHWKLDAFRANDAGTGHDLYKIAYAKSFGVPVELVDGEQRQFGKVEELLLQYQGGTPAIMTGAAMYRIDLVALGEKMYDQLPSEARYNAEGFIEWQQKQKGYRPPGLPFKAHVVCEATKALWRATHPGITKLWKALQEGAETAIKHPGIETTCGVGLRVFCQGKWLWIELPSGARLCYPMPKIVDGTLTYLGVNQYTRKWCRLKTYGGKLFENICQSIAGDILRYRWPEIEEAGYEIILTVYDENVTEAPDRGEFTAARLSEIMTRRLPWAPTLPLASSGYETQRYRKG